MLGLGRGRRVRAGGLGFSFGVSAPQALGGATAAPSFSHLLGLGWCCGLGGRGGGGGERGGTLLL